MPQWPEPLAALIDEAVMSALASGAISVADGGPLKAFEQAAADLFEAPYAVATNNGTNALLAAVEALGLARGSRVLLPAYGFYGMLAPLRYYGLEPVFVPFSFESLCSSVDDYAQALGWDPRAIVVFHPWGNVGPARELFEWADDRGLPVIADLSHAHGARYAGRGLGAFASISAASFGRGKLISGGELGVCVTHRRVLANRVLAMGHPNRKRPALPEEALETEYADYAYGPKLRPHGLALAAALPQFEGFAERMAARNSRAAAMEHLAAQSGVLRPLRHQASASRQYWRVVLQAPQAVTQKLRATLARHGFPLDGVGYRELLSDHPICKLPGATVHRQALPSGWLAEARALVDRLVYLRVPQADDDWEPAWQTALDELAMEQQESPT